jgi:hypothetical protein
MSRRAEIDRNSTVSVEMRMILQEGIKVKPLIPSPPSQPCLCRQVNHHRPDKKIVPSILSFSEAVHRLTIQPATSSIFQLSTESPMVRQLSVFIL